MKALVALLAIAIGWGMPAVSMAAADAQVEALQWPAWIERDGKRTPLKARATLRNQDQVLTGTGARALLRMADGSTVKLGENARLQLAGMAQEKQERPLFKASMAVLQGAFRFTTEAFYKFRGKRAVDVRFTTVTAGIRGTDLWGKSADDREIVVLIEGSITLARDGEASQTMDQPKTVYEAPRAAAALPIVPVDPNQLAKWAAETEIAAGSGASRSGGHWRVYVAQASSQAEARAVADRLTEAGYDAQINRIADGRDYNLYGANSCSRHH